MKYQLVLQLPAGSLADYDRLIELEDVITDGLSDIGVVDGHDYGSREMNVFIHTDEPAVASERARSLLSGRAGLGQLKAGYRHFDDDNYLSIFPTGLKKFSVP